MKHLIVGDVTEYLAIQATKFNSSAQLITENNVNDFLTSDRGVFYSSLGDFSKAKVFCEMLWAADQITYCPPPDNVWSDRNFAPDSRFSIETETREHLYQWSYIKRKPISGLDIPDFLDPVFDNTLCFNPRITDRTQIWNYGCSITVGIGVEKHQTYGCLLSQRLNLPISTIAHEGSSIRWASDQIMSSDIKKDDIIIWGLTSVNRFGYFLHDGRYYHVLASFLDNYPLMNNLFESTRLISPDVSYEALRAILTANNFCQKLGAHLIIIGVMPSYTLDKEIKNYKNFIPTDRKFIDLGDDDMHPGTKHHEFYVAKILDYMQTHQLI